MNEDQGCVQWRSGADLPIYTCHKRVRAMKLGKVMYKPDAAGVYLMPAQGGYAPVSVSVQYFTKHEPKAGGYYIVYEDGYESFSPAEAFEQGYSLANRMPDVNEDESHSDPVPAWFGLALAVLGGALMAVTVLMIADLLWN